jgi:hypothetical protein
VLHASPHPPQVDRVDAVEDLGRFVGGIAGGNLDAGVIECHVEPSECVDGGVHHGGHTVLVGDVTRDAQHLVAGGAELLGSVMEGGFVDVGKDDRSSGFGEGAGGGQAHARARTGDEGNLPGEVVGGVHNVDLHLVIVSDSQQLGGRDVNQARSILAWKVSPWRSI